MITKDDIRYIRKLSLPERDRGFTRTYYSYPAKFLSKLPHGLIKRFSLSANDLILDPFVGGGTTGLEAMLLERRFIGYDINPFAILVSRVKTTYIDPVSLMKQLNEIMTFMNKDSNSIDILDEEDKLCLGKKISNEINLLFSNIMNLDLPNRNFFLLALIHSIKIVGRRDFEIGKNFRNDSIIPIFQKKIKKMVHEISSLPQFPLHRPIFKLKSIHGTKLKNSTVDLIITSPPYKDKDIEYQKIQLQRRSLNKSKRSNIITNILQTKPLSKQELCWTGRMGENYWENSEKTLKECYRILKYENLAFFWVGFKCKEDYDQYIFQIGESGLNLLDQIKVTLSNDRVASARSTHHGKNTGMQLYDYLFILKK